MTTSSYPSKYHSAIAELTAAHNSPDDVINSITSKYGIDKVTPDMIPDSIRDIYKNQADQQLNPWYKNEQSIGAAKVGNQVEQTQADYQNTIDQLNNGLQTDTKALADKEGNNGTWGSSARQERMNSLANQYNNKYQSAYNNANGNLQNYGLSNEVNYGGQMPTANINQYKVNPVGQASQTNNFAKYNPFGIQNQLDYNKNSAAQELGTNQLAARIKNPNYGVNYRMPTTYVNQ
jgi:hypothetical protein